MTVEEFDEALAELGWWHADFARKFRLPFPLLSDAGGKTAQANGSLLNGFARFARRHTFIIAPDGRIAARFNQVAPTSHAQQVAHALKALQRTGNAHAARPPDS